MEYNELCRELRLLAEDSTTDPNPQLLEWVTEANNKLVKLKASFGSADEESSTSEDEFDENPSAVQNVHRLKQLQDEKTTLLNKLSEQAGIRLLVNNPALANLADNNRPSKISERFSELYDNHWTDAMEALDEHNFDEKESIDMLVEIVETINKECTKKREQRLQLMMKLALHVPPDSHHNTGSTDIYQNVQASNESGSVNLKEITQEDIRLQCSQYLSQKDVDLCQDKGTMEELHRKLSEKFIDDKRHNVLKNKSVRHYIEKCYEISWSTCLQIPPVVMVFDTSQPDLYRTYTRSGDVIEYIVWPALLLHENGPVLYKGVAQMTANKDINIYENTQSQI